MPQRKDKDPRYDWEADAGTVYNDIQSLEKAIDSTRTILDNVKERLVTLTAEYSNDKEWVHTTLRSVLATQDKVLDRISRLEGKFENGINKTVVDLRKELDQLRSESSEFVTDQELKDAEARIDEKRTELRTQLDKTKSEQAEAITGVDKSRKESWGTAFKTIGLIIGIVGQLILFTTLIVTLIQL